MTHLHAASKGTDQPARMRELIWVIAGRTRNTVENAVSRLIYEYSNFAIRPNKNDVCLG